MESKKQLAREEKKTMSKAQEVHYYSDFKAADRALERARGNRS
ncbi:YfhE family protein [Bacillaceae bacterium IKA-2]|nr:YfhE family protein [Bacillaceae bacterium IKA-2]